MQVIALLAISLSVSLGCLSNAALAAAVHTQPEKGLHGQSWAFGQSADREDVLWQKGVDGAAISKKAQKKPAATKSMDSRTGINQALANSAPAKGKIGLDFKKQSSSWTVAPELKATRPDEDKSRASQHVLRAYAGVEAAEDFNISVGPELILKDDEKSAEAANPNQPDSALGLGMKFQFDF